MTRLLAGCFRRERIDMGAGYRPTDDDWLQDAWHEQSAADAAAGAYPITRRALERLRALVEEAHGIAASVRDSGPSAVHCEAYNLTAGIGDVDRLVQDLTTALAMAEAG